LVEAEARELIDELLSSAGWSVQDYQNEDFSASLGIAVREFQLKTGAADYLLFINRRVVGVIEAKPVGHTLGGVDYQSEKYVEGLVEWIEPLCLDPKYPIPFLYESTGVITYFRDLRDPASRSRRVFAFHRPETLRDWLKESDTLRGHIRRMPPLNKGSLRDCQFNAILNLEQSLRDQRPRALIQMARLRKNLHDCGSKLSSHKACESKTYSISRRPQQPGQTSVPRVPQLQNPRRRPKTRRALQHSTHDF